MILYLVAFVSYLFLFAISPELLKKIAVAFFVFTFFVVAIPFLNSENNNYNAYCTFLTFIVFMSFLVTQNKFKLDINVIYLFWFLLSVLVNYPILEFKINYQNYIFPITTLSLYLLFISFGNYNMIRYFFKLIIVMVVIQSILGTMQSFFGFPIFPNVTNIFEGNRNYLAFIFPSISSLVQQGTGTFEHFNELGGLLSLTVPIVFGWWFYNKSKTRLAILLISSLGLITTFSRGALLGSIVGISFMLILNSNKKVMNKIVFISAFAFIFIAWKYISDYYSMTQNLSIRYDTWTFAWQYASEHPLELIWGYGIYFFHNNILGLQDTITNLHSGQLQILLELGIIGITIFLSSFIATIKKAIKDKHPVSITFVSGIIAFFIHQLFDNSLFSYIATIYFIFIAIVQLSLTNEDIQNLFSKKGTN